MQRDDDGLDALINNAGIGTSGAKRELSADGFELRFAVNYLAGFLLTRLLLPALESTRTSRIVNVASAGQQPIDFSDVMLTRGYSGVRAYRQSKLAQIMFTIDLAKELAGRSIAVNCLHPATFMDTTMVRLSGVQPISTVEQGGAAILQLADLPALVGRSGLYFNGLQESRADRKPTTRARAKLARAELRARRPRRSAGGPAKLGRGPWLICSQRRFNAMRSRRTGAPPSRLTPRFHRVLIAPHICWRADPVGHTGAVAHAALIYRLATNVRTTPMAGRLLWEPTRWI